MLSPLFVTHQFTLSTFSSLFTGKKNILFHILLVRSCKHCYLESYSCSFLEDRNIVYYNKFVGLKGKLLYFF